MPWIMAFETPYILADIHAGRRRRLRGLMPALSTPEGLALMAVLILSAFFLLFPGVDIEISDRFYREGDGFPLSDRPELKLLRRSSTWVIAAVVLAAIGKLIHAGWSAVSRPSGSPQWRTSAFCLAGLVVGPGLVVNGLFKSYWGRPRPLHTELFGADSPYVPAWRMTHECIRNCSFVSGEASSSAWMLTALLLIPPRWRGAVAVPLTLYVVSVSVNRIAFGAHFLSDVVLSWALTGLVLAALYRVMMTVNATGPAFRLAPLARPA